MTTTIIAEFARLRAAERVEDAERAADRRASLPSVAATRRGLLRRARRR